MVYGHKYWWNVSSIGNTLWFLTDTVFHSEQRLSTGNIQSDTFKWFMTKVRHSVCNCVSKTFNKLNKPLNSCYNDSCSQLLHGPTDGCLRKNIKGKK